MDKRERMAIWRDENRQRLIEYNRQYRANMSPEQKAHADELRKARRRRARQTPEGKIKHREERRARERKQQAAKAQAAALMALANFDPADAVPIPEPKPRPTPKEPETRKAEHNEQIRNRYWSDPVAARERKRLWRLKSGKH